MNNKGTTLMELIISIALMSIILVFMVRMIIDVNNLDANRDYASDNSEIRMEMMRTIENDLNGKKITNIADNSSQTSLVINFTFKDSTTASINITSSSLTYTSSSGTIRKWTLEEGSFYTDKAVVYYRADDKTFTLDGSSVTCSASASEDVRKLCSYSLIIDIEVHTMNDNNTTGNNNTIDDISLSYIGLMSDYNTTLTCLGYYC